MSKRMSNNTTEEILQLLIAVHEAYHIIVEVERLYRTALALKDTHESRETFFSFLIAAFARRSWFAFLNRWGLRFLAPRSCSK